MKIRILTIILLIFIDLVSLGQTYSTNNKKAIKLFEQAMTASDNGDFGESIELLKEAIKSDPDFFEAYLLSSDIYQEIDSTGLQVEVLEKAIQIRKSPYAKVYYTLGNAYYASGNYQKAINAYNQYLEEAGESGVFVVKAKLTIDKCIGALNLLNIQSHLIKRN